MKKIELVGIKDFKEYSKAMDTALKIITLPYICNGCKRICADGYLIIEKLNKKFSIEAKCYACYNNITIEK